MKRHFFMGVDFSGPVRAVRTRAANTKLDLYGQEKHRTVTFCLKQIKKSLLVETSRGKAGSQTGKNRTLRGWKMVYR